MRIIAGKKRGVKLISPGQNVRPTTDRVKEAMFGSIQFEIPGANVLDLFAGSGALGLEAASRGAESVVMVDADSASVDVIYRNIERVGGPPNVKIIKSDYRNAIKLFQNREKFDIVLIDPPYQSGYYEDAVTRLAKAQAMRQGGILVLESDHELVLDCPDVQWYRTKRLGGTFLTFGRFGKEND